jgi:hypothetical protein
MTVFSVPTQSSPLEKDCVTIVVTVISTEGRNLASNDMNNLRFLTYVRNDSLFYYETVSPSRGRQKKNNPIQEQQELVCPPLEGAGGGKRHLRPIFIY